MTSSSYPLQLHEFEPAINICYEIVTMVFNISGPNIVKKCLDQSEMRNLNWIITCPGHYDCNKIYIYS